MSQPAALSEAQVQLIARALADPRRYEILKRLASHESATTCTAVRECMCITPATLSHHMKELETAGLIHSEKEGKFVRYTAQTEVLRAYLKRLQTDLMT